MLADFADEFDISLPRMQLLMRQIIGLVINAIEITKCRALEQVLSKSEIYHIELCIEIIKEAALALSKEVTLLPSMKALFD
jgi:serine/threonine-protein kinase HipA